MHAEVRTETALTAIPSESNAQRLRTDKRMLRCGPQNAETEVEAERSKEAQDVQLTRGAE
jgi:hypothetical protein